MDSYLHTIYTKKNKIHTSVFIVIDEQSFMKPEEIFKKNVQIILTITIDI